MMLERAVLEPVDEAEVLVLVDNSIDIYLTGSECVRRAPTPENVWYREEHLRAEHGIALLLTVTTPKGRASILYDAGMGRDTVLHNLDVLEMRPTDLRAIVLSHGHADHHGGLEGIVRRLGRPGLPLLMHPDAWMHRRIVFPTGTELGLPPPSRADLEAEGVEVVEERGPSLLLDRTVLITGQVERATDFEVGFPYHQKRVDDRWEPDPWVWDDQAVVVHVRDRGLVVLSGCSHSGGVNVLRHAQQVTGVEKIHCFVGGLHLPGVLLEPIIDRTVAELARIGPDILVPGHCSGWKAIHRISATMPDAYVPSATGTELRFRAPTDIALADEDEGDKSRVESGCAPPADSPEAPLVGAIHGVAPAAGPRRDGNEGAANQRSGRTASGAAE
jgi:7,8-dihydropterin-6-yl-methyl-4-(beta-D-ribofuranosyl)aminobenzene 5'-phosphate synthase